MRVVVVESDGSTETVYEAGPSPLAAWTRARDWIGVVEGSGVTLMRVETRETV